MPYPGGVFGIGLPSNNALLGGSWSQDKLPYLKNTLVEDDGWLMGSLRRTFDRAAPQPLGESAFVLPEAPAWLINSNVSSVYTGHLYTFTEGGWVEQVRVWCPELSSSTNYRFILVLNPNGPDPIYRAIEEPISIEGGWTVITAGNLVVGTGTELLIYIDAFNSSASSDVTGGWINGGRSNTGAPAAKSWNVNNQDSILRIDKTDLDDDDRTTELLGITPNSTIKFSDTVAPANFKTYSAEGAAIDRGAYIEYPSSLVDSGGNLQTGNTTTMLADIPTHQDTEYVEVVDHWVANQPSFATVTGYKQYNGVSQPGFSNTAFGIDIKFQRALISPDWKYYAYSDAIANVSGGGGSNSTVGTSSKTLKGLFEDLVPAATNARYSINPQIKSSVKAQLSPGDYLIWFSFDATINATNRAAVVELFYDDGTGEYSFGPHYRQEPKDVSNNTYPSKFFKLTVEDKTVYEFIIKYGREGGGGGSFAVVDQVRLLVEVL